jgi:prepilin-type N-terminal cleavage/methylation domain-containing protein
MSEVENSVTSKKRKGFTLLELLIVILLLSLFAFLVFGTMKRQSEGARHPEVSQIRKILLEERQGMERELICLEECQSCFFFGSEHELEKNEMLFPPIKAYGIDAYDQPVKMDFGRWRDRPICLRIRVYANGSIDRMILESEGKFYYLPAYFGKARSFESLSDAVGYWLRDRERFHDEGDYF